MKNFRDRVAVVTGGAGGLGRAMAERFAREGMRVVIADVDAAALARTEAELRAGGADVAGVRCDVAKAADVEALAQAALARYGAVHVAVNNAGVSPVGPVWENTVRDWEWALGVNLWGVIHGVRVFTPILLAQGDEGHIVNTASVAGLINPPGMGVYNASKHAVVSLTETLHHDLARRGARVKCSVLCPAYVPTGIHDSERTRPKALVDEGRAPSAEQVATAAMVRKAVLSGRISAAQVAEAVLAAIRDERFYILTHERIKPAIAARMEDILSGATPRDPLALG
ncbi:MAG: SDR family NAD(P)-dependent oxidoreductase [Burkholderiales bacterium]|nr:SDR family NAD(P)-dependent oxidoreductase [Burkholderiales bacterium]